MLSNQEFAQKLQIIFLPLILAPLVLVSLIVFLSMPPILQDAQKQLLELKLDQALKEIEDSHNVLLRTGIENDIFFRRTSENRITDTIKDLPMDLGEFFLYKPTEDRYLVYPEDEQLVSTMIFQEMGASGSIPRQIRTPRSLQSQVLYLLRYFEPWELVIGIAVDIRKLNLPITRLFVIFFLVVSLIIVLAVLLIRRLSTSISLPIRNLVDTVTEFGAGNFHRRSEAEGKDEIAVLSTSFNTMAERISRFTQDLNKRVEERTLALQENLEILQQTQSQLIESEKLAGLGSVVSGVAHEINTPLGVGITSASFLEHQIENMYEKYTLNSLTRSEMDKILSQSKDSIKILLDNLQRAQVLVQSFKEVSADQLVDELREFNLHDYIKEILSSLHNQIKRQVGTVEISGSTKVVIHSYPGAYWQILSNLIQNSLIHAFTEEMDKAPELSIQYEVEDEDLNIVFSDNGVGMPEMIRQKAFEPFVTTRRGKGGTGLGLNIVFNIIQRLNGRVSIESSKNGTSVFIHIPSVVSSDYTSSE